MAEQYLAPGPWSAKSSPDGYLGWCKEVIQQGAAYLKSQPAYPYIDDGTRLVNGQMMLAGSNSLSDAKTDQTLRNLKELIAAQTNIRIIPAFKSEIGEFEHTQTVLNRGYMAWQHMTFADRALRKAWQYAGATGTGYIGVRWDANFWRRGRGDIVFDWHGPLDVMPIGIPHTHRLREAYAVALLVRTPYHQAVAANQMFADKIKPTGEDRGRAGVISEAVKLASAVLRRFGPQFGQEGEPTPWGNVNIYNIYIDDQTINTSGKSILMGDPGTTWQYTVPALGDLIQTGIDNEYKPIYRKAEQDDCRLYPNGRLIKCTDTVVLNPNPVLQVNPYWSGLPISQFLADDWPWTFLGFPLSRGGFSIEKANISMFRGIVDAINARLSPSRSYDRNTMSAALASAIDPRVPNQVVGLDHSYGPDQLKPLLPAEYYNIPSWFSQFIEANEKRIKEQMGVADAAALSRARQLPSGDSVERLMEAMGPLIKDQSRNMEASIRDLGEIWKNMFFQFYSARRRMQMLGADGITAEDLEYKPGDLVPDRGVPGERPGMGYFDRARLHASNFSFSVTPYSLHELNSVTRKLFHLQLIRAGFPIDWWTLAEVFDIRNFGPKPKKENKETGEVQEIDNVFERWIAQEEIKVRFQAALQQAAQQGAGGGEGGGDGGSPAMGNPPKGPGRPPTGQTAPTLVQKPGEARSVIRESNK